MAAVLRTTVHRRRLAPLIVGAILALALVPASAPVRGAGIGVGFIAGTISPAAAFVTVDGGRPVPIAPDGSFNTTEAPGVHPFLARLGGFQTYYANVTVVSGEASKLNITLQPAVPVLPGIDQPDPYATIIPIAAGVVFVAVLLVFAVFLLRRKRRPPAARATPGATGGRATGRPVPKRATGTSSPARGSGSRRS